MRDIINESGLARHCALTVLDLPTDLLYSILSYFTDDCVSDRGDITWGCRDHFGAREEDAARRRAVQNIRLVCHAFYDLAAPLLCPAPRVYLSQESLDAIEALSRSPAVAAGVRGLQIVLPYRPAELAQDFGRFYRQRMKMLDDWYSSCGYFEESWELGGYDTDDESICELPHRVYAAAMEEYKVIRRAWGACVNSDDRDHVTVASRMTMSTMRGHVRTYASISEFCAMASPSTDGCTRSNIV
jgi:hypothetical protein